MRKIESDDDKIVGYVRTSIVEYLKRLEQIGVGVGLTGAEARDILSPHVVPAGGHVDVLALSILNGLDDQGVYFYVSDDTDEILAEAASKRNQAARLLSDAEELERLVLRGNPE